MMHPVYMDSHSTTPVDPEVLESMIPYMTERFGNASSMDHSFGYDASVAVEDARERVAGLVGARHDEIVFTSGATESDNMALYGVMSQYADRGDHLITCETEHKAVLHAAAHLESLGKRVTYLPVNSSGHICVDDLECAITDSTVAVSIMLANNEIGTIADMRAIGKVTRSHNIILHTDAAQAAGHIPIDVDDMGIDVLSMSAHKMHGPKGVGALYVRRMRPSVQIDPIIRGGGQEYNLRSGTLNVPGIVGFGYAAQLASKHMREEDQRHRVWTDEMLEEFRGVGATLNGHPTKRLAHNLNVCIPGIEGKAVINSVSDMVAISAGSACTTQTVEPSHVLLALGLSEEQAHQSIRLGLGRFTTAEEVKFVTSTILEAVMDISRSSP